MKFKDVVDYQTLKKLLAAFSEVTGLGVAVIERHGKESTEELDFISFPRFCQLILSTQKGKKICLQLQISAGEEAYRWGEPYIFQCPAGLIEWAAPIVIDGKLLGVLIAGQILVQEPDSIFQETICRLAEELNLSMAELLNASREIKIISEPKVQASSQLLYLVASHLMKLGLFTLEQRREINELQSRLAEEIQSQKREQEITHQDSSVTGVEISIPSLYSLEKERELLGKVRLGDKEGARAILNELLGAILFRHAGRFDIIKARILELMVVLSRAAVEAGASLEMLLGLNYQYLRELANINSQEELCLWIVKVLEVFMNSVYQTRNLRNIQIIEKALRYIREHYNEPLTLKDVAREVNLSPFYFARLLKREMGITFLCYLTRVRMEEAKRLLPDPSNNILEVALEVGYNDQSYFTKVFKKHEGITPALYCQRFLPANPLKSKNLPKKGN